MKTYVTPAFLAQLRALAQLSLFYWKMGPASIRPLQGHGSLPLNLEASCIQMTHSTDSLEPQIEVKMTYDLSLTDQSSPGLF